MYANALDDWLVSTCFAFFKSQASNWKVTTQKARKQRRQFYDFCSIKLSSKTDAADKSAIINPPGGDHVFFGMVAMKNIFKETSGDWLANFEAQNIALASPY
jgi:hypothetical protein